MSTFEKKSETTRSEYFKRVIHSGEQFYDFKVVKVDDEYSIDLSSSQTDKAHITGRKEEIEVIISYLQEAIKL